MSEQFNLDREISIEKNVDALGKKWEIHFHRGTSLCHIRPNPDRVDANIPEVMSGSWTKPSLLKERLLEYLNTSWDHADVKIAEAARVKLAAKVAKKEADTKKED